MKTNNKHKTKIMNRYTSSIGLSVIAAMTSSLAAQTDNGAQPDVSLEPGNDSQSPPIYRLEPTLHFRAAHGNTTIPDGAAAFGGHDPRQDNFNLQGIELGTNIHIGDYVKGFATVNIFKPDGEEFESEFEEGFIKLVNLPGGFEIRGGRMLARLGDQNARHLHAWDFADANLMNVRYLGEDGLAIEGAEITWLVPTPWEDALSVGFGSAVAHDHAHGDEGHDDEHDEDHDEHEDEDHHDEDHDDDHDEDHDEHGHSEEAEMARPEKNIVAIRYQAVFGPNDFHRFQAGGSFVTGDNGFGMTTRIYGADLTYTWRENGLESGGQHFRWRTEWLMRDVENDEGGFEDSGFSTALMWGFSEGWEAGLRYDYVEGVADPDLPERHRISPSITRRFDFGNDLQGLVRLQYNHDDIDGVGKEDSIWLQFGFDWGPGEVR